jgi:hypothetical protein
MRIRFALAFVLSAAAAPAYGQRPGPVYHGAGYDIVLPARCRLAQTESKPANGYRMQMYAFKSENAFVIVERFNSLAIPDTSLATRRAMLQFARVAVLGKAAEITPEGEPSDFERGDRLGLRLPVRMPARDTNDGNVHGTVEVSVARNGEIEMWMVMVFDRRHTAATAAAGERVLDSFSLTHAPPAEAEAGATLGGSKDASAENKAGKAER